MAALLVVVVAVGASPVAVAWWAGYLDGPSPVTDLSPIVGGAACFGVAALAAVAAWSVVRRLPRRTIRRPGMRRRRHHYQEWGHVTGVLTGATTIWVWLDGGLVRAYQILIVGLIVTLALRRAERRHRAQVETFPDDLHGHVLYLRPFLTERRKLFRVPDKQAEFTGQGLRNFVALDEFLAPDIARRIGPFVALGNPAEVLPAGGATRMYLDDDGWELGLARLADTARAIVMEPGRTESLHWELEYIETGQLQTRLFLVTPTQGTRGRGMALTRIVDALTGWQTITWREFAQELSTVKLFLTGDSPRPVSVVSFDGNGSSVVLAQGLRTPAEVVDVIAARAAAI
jgi:hypothetical protein